MDVSFIQCGYNEAFDYCQLMLIKLNSRQEIAKKFSLLGSETEDIERAEGIASFYSKVDKRLKLFFDCERKGVSFMSQYLYEMKSKNQIHTIEDFLNVIKRDKAFKEKLILFYLGENTYLTDNEVMHALMTSFDELCSNYKEMLMYFLMFEIEYMELLFESMLFVGENLKELYRNRREKLNELERKFDFDVIVEKKRTLKKWAKELQQVEISFSVCNPYVVVGDVDLQQKGWLILGYNYIESLVQRWDMDVSIEQFGNALGDELRVRIIHEVGKCGEMSAPSLAKMMNLPSSAIFYHLDVLRKATFLCSRMKGRTALYWINRTAFEKMIIQLKELGGL